MEKPEAEKGDERPDEMESPTVLDFIDWMFHTLAPIREEEVEGESEDRKPETEVEPSSFKS